MRSNTFPTMCLFPLPRANACFLAGNFALFSKKMPLPISSPMDSHAGGISELKRIANMAEVYYMHIMPHCAIGPVAFSACMQVDAVVPNFLIQEQVDAGLGEDLLQDPWVVQRWTY